MLVHASKTISDDAVMPGHFFHDESAQAHGVYILADGERLACGRAHQSCQAKA